MSLKLWISSPLCSEIEPLLLLQSIQFPCNISRICSSVAPQNMSNFTTEPGFKLKFWSITDTEFKNSVWPVLVNMLGVRCAFIVKDNQYMGCVLNWPGVFTGTNCAVKCTKTSVGMV